MTPKGVKSPGKSEGAWLGCDTVDQPNDGSQKDELEAARLDPRLDSRTLSSYPM